MNKLRKVYIVLDNLRVGGIQRLALDEAYALSAQGFHVSLLILEKEFQLDDIREIDSQYFASFDIEVVWIPGSNWQKIKYISRLIKELRISSVISHSAKGVFILRIGALLVGQKLKILGFVHQLITLSDRKQQFKRILFFSLADELRASSLQFVLELNRLLKYGFVSNLVLRKKMQFDRMGVYLNRLDFQVSQKSLEPTTKTTLVFMSRLAIWKGFGKFVSIARQLGDEFEYMVVTSRFFSDSDSVNRLCSEIHARLVYGTNIARVSDGRKFIHVYPSDYGLQVKYPQSIGMNVLECLALGIPSLISHEEFWSWPELAKSSLVKTTDWSPEDVEDKIRHMKQVAIVDLSREIDTVRSVVSINEHVGRLQTFLNR